MVQEGVVSKGPINGGLSEVECRRRSVLFDRKNKQARAAYRAKGYIRVRAFILSKGITGFTIVAR